MRYIPWDFKHYAKLRGGEVLPDLAPVIASCLDATGLFLCAPTPPSQEARRTNESAWVGCLPLSVCTAPFQCSIPVLACGMNMLWVNNRNYLLKHLRPAGCMQVCWLCAESTQRKIV